MTNFKVSMKMIGEPLPVRIFIQSTRMLLKAENKKTVRNRLIDLPNSKFDKYSNNCIFKEQISGFYYWTAIPTVNPSRHSDRHPIVNK